MDSILDFLNNGMQAGWPQAPEMPQISNLSKRIQELLGAKEPDQGGMAQDILSSRFDTGYGDYAQGVVQSAMGKPTLGPQVAESRMGDTLKTLATLEKLGGDSPSAVKEYEFYNKLAPQDQQRFLEVKRQQQWLNLGDKYANPKTGTELTKGVPPQDDPALKGKQEGEKKKNELIVQAQADLPRIADQGQQAIDTINQTLEHPGLPSNFGLRGVVPNVPGSQAADAAALLDQIKGGAFLTAYGQLRGGGAITEVEGEKATAAYTRMKTAQSLDAFKKAANEYIGVIQKGVQRARNAASGQVFEAPTRTQGGAPGTLIGTSGGKKVYALPDGSHVMEQ